MNNTCLLSEIKLNQFFCYKNNIYKKVEDNKDDTCFCYQISYKKNDNEHFKNYLNNFPWEKYSLKKALRVTKWNEQNFKLKVLNLSSNSLGDKQISPTIFYNFIYIDNNGSIFKIIVISDSIVHKFGTDALDEKKICVGTISFNINDGYVDLDSFIFVANKTNDNVDFILNTIYKQLIDIPNDIKLIYETAYDKNILFDSISKIHKKINNINLDISIVTNIKASLEIIYYCVLKSKFYLSLSNIRSIKSCIYDFIFDDFFVNKIPYFSQNKTISDDEFTEMQNNEKISKESREILKKLEHLMVNKHNEYYKLPIYFSQIKFDYLKEEMFSNNLNWKNSLVTKFIELNIVSEKFMSKLKIANLLVNNAVHKNNYDAEHYEGWYINKKELEILTKTLEIFMEVLYKYIEFKNKK